MSKHGGSSGRGEGARAEPGKGKRPLSKDGASEEGDRKRQRGDHYLFRPSGDDDDHFDYHRHKHCHHHFGNTFYILSPFHSFN